MELSIVGYTGRAYSLSWAIREAMGLSWAFRGPFEEGNGQHGTRAEERFEHLQVGLQIVRHYNLSAGALLFDGRL